MNKIWIYALTSFITMTVSMSLLVVFVKYYTIPHGSTHSFQHYTTCKVIDIYCRNQNLSAMIEKEASLQRKNIAEKYSKTREIYHKKEVVKIKISSNFSNHSKSFVHNGNITAEKQSTSGNKSLNNTYRTKVNGDHTYKLIGDTQNTIGHHTEENSLSESNSCQDITLKKCVTVSVDIMDTDHIESFSLVQDPWVYYSIAGEEDSNHHLFQVVLIQIYLLYM